MESQRRQEDEQEDTYRDRREEPQGIEPNRSDLADDLKVPYPFDTQAARGTDSAREPQPPSAPVQTTPPPNKEPATSLRSTSNIYTVANPEVLRAQGTEPLSDAQFNPRQYSGSEGRKTAHSEVRFNSASGRPPSLHNRQYGRSPVKDRAPTPYAPSPEREDPPRSPADWEVAKESKSREQSSTSKRTLPPQHPPLDTLHNTPKPGSRGTKDDNQSIKRVYVESPSFTKEEEEEYRFVSSRLEEADERKQETVREMEPAQRGYGGDDNPSNGQSYANSRSRKMDENARNGYADSRSRKTGSDYSDRRRTYDKDRYEDKNQEDRNQERYEDKGQGQQYYKDTEERHQDMNQGYYEEQRNKDRRTGSEKYSDRMKHTDGYDEPDRYERLRDERNEYEREARRDNEPEYRDSYKKQNTDDRDLEQEAEYQRDLKRRIDKQSVKIKNKSDRYANENRYEKEKGYEKENELRHESHDRRDSLEYPAENRDMGYMRDSLDYDQQQQDWENPPQNPYQDNPAYYPGDYTKQDSRPDFYDAEDVERMDIVNPKAPKYDYIEHNKLDYGKNPMKSYRDIVHRKREEEEKLDHVFVTPKVPSKSNKKTHKKAQSAQPVHMGYQAPPQYPVGFKPSSAEELWAMKARNLSEKKGSAGNGKSAKSSANKAVPKWNTNPQVKKVHKYESPAPLPNHGQVYKPTGSYQPSSTQDQGGYSQTQGGYSTPTHQLQPLDNRPTAPVSTEIVPTAVKPSSPFRRHMELKPITQEIVTEDGQRISVDINLRLISPPPQGQSGVGSPNQQQQQLALVPIQETQGPMADSRVVGVPYQMQDGYGGYDAYNPGYVEEPGQMVPYNNGYQGYMEAMPYSDNEARMTSEELALVDPSGYSKRYQLGSVGFKDDQASNTDQKSLEDGYAAIYHKMKSKDPTEHPWYKIYNITDYKKMQREVRLNRGTLGPDLDTESYKDKMEKRHKQFEYARMVMEKNRMELGHRKPPKFPRPPAKEGEEGVKRKNALEYAKNVPKPAGKHRPNQYNSYEVAAQLTTGANSNKVRSPGMAKSSPLPAQTLDIIDIRTLEQRHLQEKQKTDKIRRNMDSVLTQKAH